MITYVQPQLWKGGVVNNTDRVFAAIAMPKGGVFHGMNARLTGQQTEKLVIKNVMWGITAYSVPILDPDAAATYDAIWDAQVPKNASSAASVLDLDTAAADATPEYEPGQINWAGVFDMESGPRRLYRKRGMVGSTTGGFGSAATGTMTHYLPTLNHSISVTGGQRARVPTAIMFAFSNPVLDITSATLLTSPTEKEWLRLRYLKDTAVDAYKFLAGLEEAGINNIYEDAATFLAKTLAPAVYEETAAEWGNGQWDITVQSKFTMSVPGEIDFGLLDGDK